MRRALSMPVLAGAVLAIVGITTHHTASISQAQAEQDRLVSSRSSAATPEASARPPVRWSTSFKRITRTPTRTS